MSKTCQNKWCQTRFEVTNFEQELTERIRAAVLIDLPLPQPNLCPNCRHEVRASFRNERFLYKRKDNLDGKEIISVYQQDAPFPVYSQNNFFSDKWNAFDYAQEYDPSRPFFSQFAHLYKKVPRVALVNQASENSEYCNYAYRNKNCYLIFGSHYEEDCLYCVYTTRNKNVVDCEATVQSEKIYQSYYANNCHSCTFVEYCLNSSNCHFSYDLIGCRNCFLCFGIRNKEYMIQNVQYSKEEYEKKMAELNLGSYTVQKHVLKMYQQLKAQHPKLYSYQKNTENSTGDQIENTKNCFHCFNISESEDVMYALRGNDMKVCYQVTNIGYDPCEYLYEAIGNNGQQRSLFVNSCWHGSDFMYSEQCFDSESLFGCIGIKSQQYCILNKQYSKEDYQQLVKTIVTNMINSGEFGHWFPKELSPFGYNESKGMDFSILSKEQALQRGYKWKEEEQKVEGQPLSAELPDDISSVSEDICQKVLTCQVSKKPYKIISQELCFYKMMNLPLPRVSPHERNKERGKLRKTIYLWKRNCMKCNTMVETNYDPKTEESILCEQCYQAEVY
jgi:hypothetical protein